MGMAYDEFAMWLELDNIYHDRRNYDAVVVISLILINVIYFSDFWKRWGGRIGRLFRFLIWRGPKRALKILTSQVIADRRGKNMSLGHPGEFL
jgi:hypothetical protein